MHDDVCSIQLGKDSIPKPRGPRLMLVVIATQKDCSNIASNLTMSG